MVMIADLGASGLGQSGRRMGRVAWQIKIGFAQKAGLRSHPKNEEWQMNRLVLATALLSSGLLIAPAAFAQQTNTSQKQQTEKPSSTGQHSGSMNGMRDAEHVAKQKTAGEGANGEKPFPDSSK